MLCPQCGTQVDKSYKFCPSCGAALPQTEKNSQSPIKGSYAAPSEDVKKRPMPLWFKILLALAVLALIGVTAGILFTESLVDIVDNQLSLLRKSEIEEAYKNYTSHEFQQATSLDEFRDFVTTYPIFQENQSAHFTQRSMQNHIGRLKGNLTGPDHEKVPIEYRLVKEDGKWKILSIRFLKPELLKMSQASTAQDLKMTVNHQLDALKNGNLTEAYNYSSNEFKNATSEDNFKDFVARYPILTQFNDFSFSRILMRSGVGIVSTILHMDDTNAYVKYYLVHENNTWKIWSMRILSPIEENSDEIQKEQDSDLMSATRFEDVALGTKVDTNGNIQNPSETFKRDSGNIYVNAKIINGLKGEAVQLNFKHLESQTSIITKTSIEENGDSLLFSVFSPPSGGWPEGDYQLTISSKGVTQTAKFSIER